MSRKESIAYYKIIHYKLLLFSVLIPGALADQHCPQDLTMFYVFLGTLMCLLVIHALSHIHWSKKVIAELQRTPKDTIIRGMTSLHEASSLGS
tara:strand:- start:115 stop:393 length:279 start_codon:yes stop_codon:yes gene_type:complete